MFDPSLPPLPPVEEPTDEFEERKRNDEIVSQFPAWWG